MRKIYDFILSLFSRFKPKEVKPKRTYGKPFVIDGMTFSNVEDAAKHFGVSVNTIYYWRKKGRRTTKGSFFEMGGKTFEFERDAAEYFGVSQSTIADWKKSGVYDPTFEINGVSFTTGKEAAAHFGVCEATISKWRNNGYTPLRDDSIVLGGQWFKNAVEAAKKFQVHRMTILLQWKKTGKIGPGANRDKTITIYGRHFETTREAAEYYGVDTPTARRWAKRFAEDNKQQTT